MALTGFSGVKVFSATMAKDRVVLGEKLTAWVRDRPNIRVIAALVRQSSDAAFHCLTIVVFYTEA